MGMYVVRVSSDMGGEGDNEKCKGPIRACLWIDAYFVWHSRGHWSRHRMPASVFFLEEAGLHGIRDLAHTDNLKHVLET